MQSDPINHLQRNLPKPIKGYAMTKTILAAIAAIALATPAFAEGFSPIRDKSMFVDAISGKALTRLGIKLNVSPTGAIKGSAFGKEVRGKWRWSNGLFCRDLAFGDRDLGPNCQLVERKGDTLRFTSDAGAGDSADLRLR